VGELEADATEDERATEIGTQAATPHAIVKASGSNAGDVRPSSTSLASQRPGLTAADALDHGDLARMRAFHSFGIGAPLVAVPVTLLIGGDPVARWMFWIGCTILALSNVGLTWLTTNAERYRSWRTAALWTTATIGITPGSLIYFGPFSAVVMILMLGILIIALGRSKRQALTIAAICIGGHVAVTVPIIAGVTTDVGILSSIAAGQKQLVIAEVLIATFLMSGYLLGRWARSTSAAALSELQSAMRIIGDQQQALAEVKDDVARAKQVNEGRWTGQQMGPWRLGLVLGRGSMGEVYEATGENGVAAAVKLLNAKSTSSSSHVERFHREMQVATRLESPHIVKVFQISPPDAPVPFIAMERLYGIDLATKLRSQARMPSDEVVVLLDQVARGLEVARLAGVVHRDLKPHNLFLHDGGTWKILDFGVSKLLGDEGTLTGEGGIVGTPQYMAPEQASGGQVSHLADVYALGAIAYRCLTGRSPFKGKDLAELVYQVVHVPPARPSSLVRVSLAIEEVLAVAMAKDPRRRFPSALSFAQAFIAARRGKKIAIEIPDRAWT